MKNRKNPYLFSIAVHLILLMILYFIKINSEPAEEEFVTIGFGSIGNLSSAGVRAENPTEEKQIKEPEKQQTVKEEIVKKVELPKVQNPDETNNVVVSADKKQNDKVTKPEEVEPIPTKEEEAGNGTEETGEGDASFGFEIDFGGKGKRKIYSYSLPPYPEGVSKEIDVKLKFTILSDGSVGRILPLIKADSKLELAAINSLRQWRFEPLPERAKNIEQTAVIIFPFRLR
ncbi:MAG: energy transducer TonB [Ignavibacteriae bacterium]|nr:energy transducer TonB [Ignavibacteriota bacterium]